MTNIPSGVQPGDFYVVPGGHDVGALIGLLEQLDREQIPPAWIDRCTMFQHAGLVASISPVLTVLEEEGPGMVEVRYHYDTSPILWSTGILKPLNREKIVANARSLKGFGYGWATYAYLTAHHYHLPIPGLKNYVATHRTEICSQAVDYAWDLAGDHIFTDKRIPGDVKPSDLAYRLLVEGAHPMWP